MNQQQNNTNRWLIVLGVLAVVAIGAYFMIIQPKLTQVQASQQQLTSLQSQYQSLKAVADQKPLYLNLIKQVQSRLTGVELTADPRAYIPSYLKQIEELATRDGLVVTAVVPQPLPTASGSPTPGPVPTGAAALQNAPIIGQTLTKAGHALNSSNIQAQSENAQMPNQQMTGATPVPGASGGPGPQVKAGATTSPRVNAIVYLNQSFQQVPIDMELSGNYVDLQKFLRDLNKFPKLIGVGDVTMTSEHADVGVTPKLHIVLPIIAYRLTAGQPQPMPTAAPAGGQ
ncbi:MAG TPA: type 4a pilus biogenesis protein PilO [Candidatus Acidoferrales bacterium]|nr:type 4a pilus biogenesis protein PilO [Candidatus Acidoferrales bacterium]